MVLTRREAQRLLLSKANDRAGAHSGKHRKRRNGMNMLGPGKNNLREEFLVEALHNKDVSEKFISTLQDIMDGKRRVQDGLQNAVVPALLELMIQLKSSPSEKQRMEAAKDFLDRAGYGKVSKVHNTHEDLTPDSDPLELISAISGLVRDTRIVEATKIEGEEEK